MYDLIIVGGGPAGASAGRAAGIAGLKTLLIEKEEFPRYKPCGGGLSEHARSFLDFSIPKSIQEREISGIRIFYKGKVVENEKKNKFSTLVTRSMFDEYLLKKAKETGIEIKMGEKVIDFKEHNQFVSIQSNKSEYKSKYLIMAEGAQGILKYNIRKRDKKHEYGVCMVTEIPFNNESNQITENKIDIYLDITKMGYGWIFPHDKYSSVGIGGVLQYFSHPKKKMLKFLDLHNFKTNYKLKGHQIPGGGIKRTVTSSRTILTGDAAGFVDTFAGEGLAYAIRSGQLAVKTIHKCIKNNDNKNGLKMYDRLCDIEFGNDLNCSLFFTRILHSFPRIFFNIMFNNKEVVDKYLDIPANNCTYKKYVLWLFLRIPKFLIF
ncbi:MAG: geranylgeranyl reductase family protein, partial [Candidatus Thorarchaeota archaeon]